MLTQIELGQLLGELYRSYGTEEPLRDLRGTGRRLVLGEGAPRPLCIFVGEAPGKRENVLGRPFIGPSGRILDKALTGNKISREKCWVTNAVKVWPQNEDGSTRTPDQGEIYFSSRYLWQEIALLCRDDPYTSDPSPFIVTLGRSALRAITDDRYDGIPLTQIHGRRFSQDAEAGRLHVIPTYHPSGLRSMETRLAFREDFQSISREIKMRKHMGLYDHHRPKG